ncbi:MAG: hypothetical protein JXR78_06290 [Victivallales bacterium]|nr:hypothetical protein [Victivallales bacterium]
MIVAQSGSYAETNPFRFSSEYHDDETALVYYNYRYYNTTLGRWLSRDPIEEQSGYNLYGFIDNDSVNYLDRLGLSSWCDFCRGLGVTREDAIALIAKNEAEERENRKNHKLLQRP